MKKGKIHIGTSGWNYKHWKGVFYPVGTKPAGQLKYYQKFFDTVELNTSFYHLPLPSTFDKWHTDTKKRFLFSVKASRYITHIKKLNETEEALDVFLTRANNLEQKLGPVLFQLPPNWKIDIDRFQLFLKGLPQDQRYVFEFRNPTWYNDIIYDLLSQHNCAFCIYELNKHQSPIEITTGYVYVRLHGPGGKYQGKYNAKILRQWAKRLLRWSDEGKDVYFYFDNDQAGYAVFNALRLKEYTTR